jgi:hypothetical protein
MNSYITVADLGEYARYDFYTMRIGRRKYVCKINKEEYLTAIIREFVSAGFNGPTLFSFQTPYFGGTCLMDNPVEIMQVYELNLRDLYLSVLMTFLRSQYRECNFEVFF